MHQPLKEIEFIASRLAQEQAAAASCGETESIHRQLAEDYAAALKAYRRYAAQVAAEAKS